jgi:hypothetical protein
MLPVQPVTTKNPGSGQVEHGHLRRAPRADDGLVTDVPEIFGISADFIDLLGKRNGSPGK